MPSDELNRDDHMPESVQRQVTELAQRRYEPAVRHELLRLMKLRREPDPRRERGPDHRHEEVTQFDYLPVEVGFDTLLVPGELLISAASYRGNAEAYVKALGLTAADVECGRLRGRILKLTRPGGIDASELADVARNLRTRGLCASITNITPTAPVIKGPILPAPPPGQSGPSQDLRRPGGQPARVAIIDTGIASQREQRTDGWLTGIRRTPENIDRLHMFPLPDAAQPADEHLDFDAGHGTFVAGIVQQIARGADISVYRAIDSDGIGSEVTVACTMIEAFDAGAQIINLSLGCQTLDDFPPVAISAALDYISDREREEGREVLIVAAAGNYASTRPCWPAAFPGVVSVAGLAPDLLPSTWSSRGFWVTCSTIGQGLRSTYVYGDEDPLVDPVPAHFAPPNPWAVWSGTSFAAPQIAGAVAQLYDQEGHSPREALRLLLRSGTPLPDFGRAVKILPGV